MAELFCQSNMPREQQHQDMFRFMICDAAKSSKVFEYITMQNQAKYL